MNEMDGFLKKESNYREEEKIEDIVLIRNKEKILLTESCLPFISFDLNDTLVLNFG
jgi:hypothetical protein